MKAMILAGAAAALFLVSGCSNPKVFPPPADAPAKVHKMRPLLPEERVSVDPLPPAFREGRIVVRAVRGRAWSMGAKAWTPVKINMVLQAGAVIATEEESGVDLFAAINGQIIRVMENSELAVEALGYRRMEDADVIMTKLHLRQGKILTHVRKLPPESEYQVRTRNGFALVTGTEFELCGNGKARVSVGSMALVHEGVTHHLAKDEMFDPATREVRPFEKHPEGTAGRPSCIISSRAMEPYQFLFASFDSFESGLRRAQSARGVFDPLGRLSPPSFQAPICGFQVFEGFLDCD